MKKALLTVLSVWVFLGVGYGVTTSPVQAEAQKPPHISLERVEIAGYWGWWFDAANRRGATLALAVILNIHNPNPQTLLLDDLKFTVAFEDFEVNTVMVYEDNHIPPQTTDQLRVTVLLDSWITNGLLAVTSGHRLLEMKTTGPALLEKWWTGISDFTFPIEIRNGTATFENPRGDIIRAAFSGVFPKK